MTDKQKDVAFNLFIIEGVLTQDTLDIHMRTNSKIAHHLNGLTLDEINESNRNIAERMNKEIGYDIY